mmetsp:Transcript_25676/g.59632  ORF Transcript_25676/g.59632 Transcript_25676/m.59632 type:complete len:91 (+) Transcript_25676:1-273(+)
MVPCVSLSQQILPMLASHCCLREVAFFAGGAMQLADGAFAPLGSSTSLQRVRIVYYTNAHRNLSARPDLLALSPRVDVVVEHRDMLGALQ